MASGGPNQESNLSTAPAPVGAAPMPAGVDLSQMQANGPGFPPGVDPGQFMNLLRYLPAFSKQLAESGGLKEDAAQALSNLAQFQAGNSPGGFRVSDPGPSSHPHGPPLLGHLPHPHSNDNMLGPGSVPNQSPDDHNDDGDDGEYVDKPSSSEPARKNSSGGGRRGRGGAAVGSDEWTRQRKDNHKEVERRRRGNINEGINELGRIVPSGSGEKAKGSILSRAVQYIHHLKENEARNIEKWTLEKLLMDQAMGDLQVQLDEIRRMWEEERMARQRTEQELEALRGGKATGGSAGEKRASPEGGEAEGGDHSKKQRTD